MGSAGEGEWPAGGGKPVAAPLLQHPLAERGGGEGVRQCPVGPQREKLVPRPEPGVALTQGGMLGARPRGRQCPPVLPAVPYLREPLRRLQSAP